MTSGLVHEIDAKATVRGRQKRVTFPHKLFMDYLAAWYLCNQDIYESLKQAFPTWDDVLKHTEVVRACCGLMKGREEVITHVVNLLKVKILTVGGLIFSKYMAMQSIQEECQAKNPHFVVYPSHGRSLSQTLNTAKLVVIEDLTGEENDAALPCNADIVIDTNLHEYNENATAVKMGGVMRTLQRHRDHIIAIYLKDGSQDVMDHVSSLLPSSSLGHLSMNHWDTYHCYLPKEVVNSLSQMPQLTFLQLAFRKGIGEDGLLAFYGDLLVDAVKAWKGHSKLRVLDLKYNNLPISVCRPLLVAIAANCPCVEELKMSGNTLSRCLAGFLQNPPPALRVLHLMNTYLQAEDIESLAAAVTAGKLQHLEKLNMGCNLVHEAAMTLLLKGLAAAVTAGKLQHLEKLDLVFIKLSKAAVTPLLYALLNTLGDRELKLYLGRDVLGITIAPREHQSVEYYLQKIRTKQVFNY